MKKRGVRTDLRAPVERRSVAKGTDRNNIQYHVQELKTQASRPGKEPAEREKRDWQCAVLTSGRGHPRWLSCRGRSEGTLAGGPERVKDKKWKDCFSQFKEFVEKRVGQVQKGKTHLRSYPCPPSFLLQFYYSMQYIGEDVLTSDATFTIRLPVSTLALAEGAEEREDVGAVAKVAEVVRGGRGAPPPDAPGNWRRRRRRRVRR
jgi:hypothetical protein